MRHFKLLQIFFSLLLLGAIVISGCATGQSASPPPTQPGPTAQPKTTDKVAGNSSGENDTATGNEKPVEEAKETPAPDAAEIDSIRILIPDQITTLDPYQMVGLPSDNSVASQLWDTLTLLNDDLQVEPSLAESWRLVNNFTWEFKLRPGLNFNNGEPIDTEAVRFSVERAQSMPGSLETFARDVDLEKVEIIDDYTLRFVTHRPVVNLPYHLAFLEILPPRYYTETRPAQLAVAPVGSGPYRLSQEWTPGQTLVLDATPTYWQGPPAWPHLEFETIPLPEERLAALRQEKNVLATDLPPIPADQWDVPGSRLEAIESTRRMFVGIHIEEGSPLADKRVRQALNYGVNAPQIINDWLAGYGEPYGSWVNPPNNNPDLAPWPYDPDLARQLLADAGYSDGFTTTLRTPAGAYYHDVEISQAIAQQLGQIGVTVEVETVSNWGVYAHDLASDQAAPLFLLGLNSRGDALEDTENLSIDFPFNPTGWHNESFEQTLEQAVNTFSENARTRLLNEAQSIAYDEAPWIWLWKSYDFYGVSQNLDWKPRPDGLIYLYRPVAAPAGDTE